MNPNAPKTPATGARPAGPSAATGAPTGPTTGGAMGPGRTEEAEAALTDRVRQQASGVADQARRAALDAGERIRHQGRDLASRQLGWAAEELHHVSEAVHEAAGKLRAERDEHVAQYADVVGEQIDRVAQYLRNADPIDMIGGARDFARRRPEVFYGGMFVAGLAVARFLKASSRREMSEEYEGRYSSAPAGPMNRPAWADRPTSIERAWDEAHPDNRTHGPTGGTAASGSIGSNTGGTTGQASTRSTSSFGAGSTGDISEQANRSGPSGRSDSSTSNRTSGAQPRRSETENL